MTVLADFGRKLPVLMLLLSMEDFLIPTLGPSGTHFARHKHYHSAILRS
jgi:hypothetical protein